MRVTSNKLKLKVSNLTMGVFPVDFTNRSIEILICASKYFLLKENKWAISSWKCKKKRKKSEIVLHKLGLIQWFTN